MKQFHGLSSGLCMMRAFLCDENGAWLNYMILWGWTFFGHVILRRHNCLVSMLEVLSFLCQYELLCWIFRIWIFIPQLRRITLKLCQVAFHIKNSVFIIYLLEDEQELSLGMLIRLQRIYNFFIVPCYYIICFGCLWALFYTFILFLGLTY